MAETHPEQRQRPVRVSALDQHYRPGHYGHANRTGVRIALPAGPDLQQVAAWPETLREVGDQLSARFGQAPGPGTVVETDSAAVLRVEPLKWWIYGADIAALPAEQGTVLDISHSRTHLCLSGDQAQALLNRHLPVDLAETAFPVGRVLTTGFHHCAVTLWHSSHGYELFLPRAFSVSLFEILTESALQFGYELE